MSDPTKNELNIAVIDNKVDNLTDFVKDYAGKNEGITREILKTVNEHREDFVTFKVKQQSTQDTWKKAFKWHIGLMWGALGFIVGFVAWVSPIIWSAVMIQIDLKVEEDNQEIIIEVKKLLNKSK